MMESCGPRVKPGDPVLWLPALARRAQSAARSLLCALPIALAAPLAYPADGPLLAAPDASPAAAQSAPAADGAPCQLVRLADIGRTDVTATTAIFSALVRHLGYRAQISLEQHRA